MVTMVYLVWPMTSSKINIKNVIKKDSVIEVAYKITNNKTKEIETGNFIKTTPTVWSLNDECYWMTQNYIGE